MLQFHFAVIVPGGANGQELSPHQWILSRHLFPAWKMEWITGAKMSPLLTLGRVGRRAKMFKFWFYLLVVATVIASAASRGKERAMSYENSKTTHRVFKAPGISPAEKEL